MPQYSLRHKNGNSTGTNKHFVPKKVVMKITTNKKNNKLTDVCIRYDDCCFGKVMSLVPKNSKHVADVVKDCRFYGRPFTISDKETIIRLEKEGLLIFKDEIAKEARKKMLEDKRIQDIVFRASQL